MISWFEKHSKLSLGITLLIAIIIFTLSSMSFKSTGGGSNLYSTLYHIFAFFFFSLFLSISVIKGYNKKFIFLTVIIAILYGISDEIHQIFVPGRVFAFSDIFLDSVGVAFASLIYFISIEYRALKKNARAGI